MIIADNSPSALTWPKWEALQRLHKQAQQAELSDPGDYATDEEREALYSQDCPQCSRSGPWKRDARTVTFAVCGHGFPIPKKPVVARAPAVRRADDVFMKYDSRTGTFTFDDGTLLVTAKFIWTQTRDNGVEHWQITTTVAKGTYVPVGTVRIVRAEVQRGSSTGDALFALDKAVVTVIEEDLPRPVITVKWQASDRRDAEE